MNRLLNRQRSRWLAIALTLAILLQMAVGLQPRTVLADAAAGAGSPSVTDSIEVSVDGGSKQLLKLYTNGLYEAKVANVATGSHAYSLYSNGHLLEEDTALAIVSAQDVYIRYRPSESDKVVDSVNDSASFSAPAAWVGDFSSGLNSYLPASIGDWSPSDSNAYLTYQGGGVYSKTFTFKQPLANDVALNYKVAFGGDWNHTSIGHNGGNISVTIPAGTQSMTIWADSVRLISFDSISGTPVSAYQGDGNAPYSRPAGTVDVSLAASLNGGADSVYRFTQVGEELYAFTGLLSAGDYEYSTVFDSVYGYQNGGSHAVTLSQDTAVTFLYDVSEDKVYDSVHAASTVADKLNFPLPPAQPPVSSDVEVNPSVDDRIEVSVDGGNKQLLTLYTTGLYEAALANLAKGSHTYTVYYNGEALENGTISTPKAQDVYIRFRPFQEDKVIDSINNSPFFSTPAAWVGDFSSGLSSYLPTAVNDWSPGDANTFMTYQGGGIYSKTFTLTQALAADVALNYKVAFGGDWNHTSIGNNGGNISVTIPAGTQSVTIWADSVNMVSFDSISAAPFSAYQSAADAYTKPAGTVTVSLVGSMNGWNGNGYDFKQVSNTLYAYTALIPAGDYEYKSQFDHNIWFQNEDNHSLHLSGDTVVTFLYDASTQKMYDSVQAPETVTLMLGFAAPVDLDALDGQAYTGGDLGASYTPAYTEFKLWAPTASKVQLKLYSTGDAQENSAIATVDMQKQEHGTWYLKQTGDLKGVFYTYLVTIGLKTNETVDLYAEAVGVNGNRAMVVDLNDTNPAGWGTDKHVMQKKVTDAVIWETHVRDFSSDSNSGISEANRGKFLAFTERGTTLRGEGKIATGVDYLAQLGVNYVHLLPAFDFENFDNDERQNAYNWGYGPKNYNVPEGSYSSNPADGIARIKEFKEMVQGLHKGNIGVIMDVVYNHTGKASDSWFNLTVPGYYYRHNADGSFSNGSGTGNETASERAMFRKYMVESVLYWAKEYHIDGFRFDLMAVHDVDTMNAIRTALNEAGLTDVIMYGEPWTGGASAIPAGTLPANKANAKHLADGIAVFNDDLRDAIKGYVFNATGKGFVQGGNVANPTGVDLVAREYADADLMAGVQANANSVTAGNSSWTKDAWAKNSSQSISYASAHDDLSLWDKLVGSVRGVPEDVQQYASRDEALVAMNKMAAVAVITSQGIPFFQAGEEFARTKYGDHNSYQSPIEINKLDWSRLETFLDLSNYYKGLIQIRKQYAPFRDATTTETQNMVFSEDGKENLLAYTIQDTADTVAVLMNATSEEQTVTLKTKNGVLPAQWTILANKDKAGLESLGTITGANVTIPAQSAMVLVQKKENGGSNGNGSTGNSPAGVGTPAQTQTGADGKITAAPSLDSVSKQATASVSSEDIQKAKEKAKAGADGVKVIPIEVSKAAGAASYAVELPAAALTEASAASKLQITTEFGTLVIPSNMLSASGISNAEKVSLLIGAGDKSTLNETVKAQIGDRPSVELSLKVDGAAQSWSNQEAPVTVMVPYTPASAEKADPEHIVVWYLDGSGQIVPIPTGKYDAASGKVVFTTTHFSQYAVAYVHKTFDDIQDYAWARQAIEVMASKGVINGTSETTYEPADAVTRADFILLLVKALGLSGKADGAFADVSSTAYYAEAVGTAKKLGIVEGIGNHQFNPEASISRQDMMTMIYRAMNAARKNLSAGTNDDLAKFVDKDMIADYAAQSAATLAKNGIVAGDGANMNPVGHATRAETAVMIYRIYNK